MSSIPFDDRGARPVYPCSDFVLDSLPLGVVFQNTHGEITAANPAAERILGLSLDRMCGVRSVDPRWRAIREDGSPFPGEEHPAMVALRIGEPVRNVVMGVFNPQHEAQTWINVTAVPIRDRASGALTGVYSSFEDISAQKEAQRQEASSQARFQAVFTAMSEGMALHRLVYDAAGRPQDYRILDVNPAFTAQTGLAREAVVGQLASAAYGSRFGALSGSVRAGRRDRPASGVRAIFRALATPLPNQRLLAGTGALRHRLRGHHRAQGRRGSLASKASCVTARWSMPPAR